MLYEVYSGVIKNSHTRTFTNFSQEHRDIYLRLKFRAASEGDGPLFQDGIKDKEKYLQINNYELL